MSSSGESPSPEQVWIDADVGRWLHVIADKYFGGNVSLCLNEIVRISMAMYNKPDDHWVATEAHNIAHQRGAAEARKRLL
jgi:transposase-like protein